MNCTVELELEIKELELFLQNIKKSLSFNFAHGWALFFAWNIFAILQIVTARYMRHKWETNMVLHTASGTLITFATLFWGFWKIY